MWSWYDKHSHNNRYIITLTTTSEKMSGKIFGNWGSEWLSTFLKTTQLEKRRVKVQIQICFIPNVHNHCNTFQVSSPKATKSIPQLYRIGWGRTEIQDMHNMEEYSLRNQKKGSDLLQTKEHSTQSVNLKWGPCNHLVIWGLNNGEHRLCRPRTTCELWQ